MDRLGRLLTRGDIVEVPITARARRLSEQATGRDAVNDHYFDYAQQLAKSHAMIAQAQQLEELADSADWAITGAVDDRAQAIDLAVRLREAAAHTDQLIDEWLDASVPVVSETVDG